MRRRCRIFRVWRGQPARFEGVRRLPDFRRQRACQSVSHARLRHPTGFSATGPCYRAFGTACGDGGARASRHTGGAPLPGIRRKTRSCRKTRRTRTCQKHEPAGDTEDIPACQTHPSLSNQPHRAVRERHPPGSGQNVRQSGPATDAAPQPRIHVFGRWRGHGGRRKALLAKRVSASPRISGLFRIYPAVRLHAPGRGDSACCNVFRIHPPACASAPYPSCFFTVLPSG